MNQTDMNIDFFLTWIVGLVLGAVFEICRKKLKDKRQKKIQDLIDKEDQKFREVFKELYSDTKKRADACLATLLGFSRKGILPPDTDRLLTSSFVFRKKSQYRKLKLLYCTIASKAIPLLYKVKDQQK